MKNRIIDFLKEKNLTSTKFADIIGVQRSSISHILSGRNKPSFDFIEKMLIAYPDVNAQWLITGKGTMINTYTNKTIQTDLFNHNSVPTTSLSSPELNIQKNEPVNKAINESETILKNISESKLKESKIDRIVIFFNDNTFNEYKPH